MSHTKAAVLLFPHQLFEVTLQLNKQLEIFLIEDDLFFKQYRFHKQKLILHRASMKEFATRLSKNGFGITYIQAGEQKSMDLLAAALTKRAVTSIQYYDVVDDWLEQRLSTLTNKLAIPREVMPTPAFLTSQGIIEDYFSDHSSRMQSFYEWQRKRLNILVHDGKPTGGQWSFDEKNRKALPRDIVLPPRYTLTPSSEVNAAIKWVDKEFTDNPGSTDFSYPTSHTAAQSQLEQFLENRFKLFGPYEDAITHNTSQLFHSVLSPLLNIGLLTPHQVITRSLQYAKEHDTPIESLEGFIRQIIGWREYMRATYTLHGRKMRTQNHLNHHRKLDAAWWNGTLGIKPIDNTIKSILDTAYAHHIERLMVLGNSMLLLRIDPDDAYEWFMSLFIDAYDWVMVPNVYAMSQFATGDMITTKPYISGSNYIHKMSDYKKDDWSEIWDALYWRFVADHRSLFENNYRSKMMVSLYDKLTPAKKQAITKLSNQWL